VDIQPANSLDNAPSRNGGKKRKASRSIDGLISNAKHTTVQVKPKTPQANNRRGLKHTMPQPDRSATLMRASVEKPLKNHYRLIGRSTSPLSVISKSPGIISSTMVGSIDRRVAKRAQSIRLSSKVSRFGSIEGVNGEPVIHSIAPEPPRQPIYNQPAAEATDSNRPTIKQPDMFERAIEQATAHQQPKLTKKQLRQLNGKAKNNRKLAVYGLGILVVFAALGVFVYSNMQNIMVKIASSRAGFSAVIPSYHPAVFALASVSYQSGLVSMNYNNANSSSHYTINERPSSWDDPTLLNSLVIPASGNHYKTLMVAGQTLYVYNNSQVVWVSDGILYQLAGGNSLSKLQLEKLATTL
jgi:hypothetical protein